MLTDMASSFWLVPLGAVVAAGFVRVMVGVALSVSGSSSVSSPRAERQGEPGAGERRRAGGRRGRRRRTVRRADARGREPGRDHERGSRAGPWGASNSEGHWRRHRRAVGALRARREGAGGGSASNRTVTPDARALRGGMPGARAGWRLRAGVAAGPEGHGAARAHGASERKRQTRQSLSGRNTPEPRLPGDRAFVRDPVHVRVFGLNKEEPMRRIRRRRGLLLAIWLVAAVGLAGCASMKERHPSGDPELLDWKQRVAELAKRVGALEGELDVRGEALGGGAGGSRMCRQDRGARGRAGCGPCRVGEGADGPRG